MSRKNDRKRRKKLEHDRKQQERKRLARQPNSSTQGGAPIEGIMISNDGRLIESTNYWSSIYAKNGKVYFSVNAGCIRLLLPDTTPPFIGDDVLDGTRYIIVTRGMIWGKDAYEVLFEDGSDNPFVINTLANQWDRLIPVAESGRTGIGFDVYQNGQRIREMTARFRAVASLPYLKPWGHPSTHEHENATRTTPLNELVRKANLTYMVVEGKKYHSPLPAELEQFYCYVKDGGHCILVILPLGDGPVEDYAVPLPVKTVLKTGYSVKNGYVYCDVPCDRHLGVVCDKDDDEF